jgi:hypothetical protein
VEHRPFASSRGGGAKLIRAEWARVSESVAHHLTVARHSLIPCDGSTRSYERRDLRKRDDEHEAIRRPADGRKSLLCTAKVPCLICAGLVA